MHMCIFVVPNFSSRSTFSIRKKPKKAVLLGAAHEADGMHLHSYRPFSTKRVLTLISYGHSSGSRVSVEVWLKLRIGLGVIGDSRSREHQGDRPIYGEFSRRRFDCRQSRRSSSLFTRRYIRRRRACVQLLHVQGRGRGGSRNFLSCCRKRLTRLWEDSVVCSLTHRSNIIRRAAILCPRKRRQARMYVRYRVPPAGVLMELRQCSR